MSEGASSGTGPRGLSPEEEKKQRLVEERLARREQIVKARLRAKKAEEARRRAIWAKRTAMGKLAIITFVLVVSFGLLWLLLRWLGVRLDQILS
jgi:hypothetical protein